MINTQIKIANTVWKNPVSVASGTFGYGEEMAELIDLNAIGAIFVKGLTLQPKQGNPPQRIHETPAGLLNAIGLQNAGVDDFLTIKLPFLGKYDVPVYANISGNTVEQYGELARKLDDSEIAGFEINVSCPNVKEGGIAFGLDPDSIYKVTKEVRKNTGKDIITKLSPNVTDISLMAKQAEAAGADAVSLVNTLLGMTIDIRTRRPYLANNTGGLSGPAIRPVAVRMVHEVRKALSIPIIGMGGIITAEDALEFIIAGADAVSIGTGTFYDPNCSVMVANGIYEFLKDNDIDDIKKITNTLKLN